MFVPPPVSTAQIIDKQAAIYILKGLIQDMMNVSHNPTTATPSKHAATAGSSAGDGPGSGADSCSKVSRTARRGQDEQAGADVDEDGGGFFLDHDRHTFDAEDRQGGAAGSGAGGCDDGDDGDACSGGGEGSGGIEREVLISPRKKQRLRNLRLAKGMDRAREQDITVVRRWIPSVPP